MRQRQKPDENGERRLKEKKTKEKTDKTKRETEKIDGKETEKKIKD